jgi:hypothetical protein
LAIQHSAPSTIDVAKGFYQIWKVRFITHIGKRKGSPKFFITSGRINGTTKRTLILNSYLNHLIVLIEFSVKKYIPSTHLLLGSQLNILLISKNLCPGKGIVLIDSANWFSDELLD